MKQGQPEWITASWAVSIAAAILCILPGASSVAAVELFSDQPLYAEPSVKSEQEGEAKQGDVKVIERRGFWVKISAGKLTGWIKLSNLNMKESIVWMAPIDVLRDTGRLASDGE